MLPASLAAAVEAVLSVPEAEVDYAEAKLALDLLVDPLLDVDAARAELDRLTDAALRLAGQGAHPGMKLAALGRLIYEPGPWNEERPFAYDQADPEGTLISNKLLPNYLSRRLGNCVSMPVLFVILADRIGLDMALASAPFHVLVRHRMPDGRIINLETTSGAHPARDEWYRGLGPMSDRALKNGIYLRSLSRREGAALMANVVLEHLAEVGQSDEMIETAQAILRADPRNIAALVWQGGAYGQLLAAEFEAIAATTWP
jgi:regulator of sirC expression with transglutaminase-like and TPR domain